MKCYKNITTKEVVYEDEAEDYVLNELGITVTPKGKNAEMTQLQLENIEETINWFFSGNWIEEEIYDNDTLDPELELADREYQDGLERKWGL